MALAALVAELLNKTDFRTKNVACDGDRSATNGQTDHRHPPHGWRFPGCPIVKYACILACNTII